MILFNHVRLRRDRPSWRGDESAEELLLQLETRLELAGLNAGDTTAALPKTPES